MPWWTATPMLATLQSQFDSPWHAIKMKSDGFRSPTFNDKTGLLLIGHRATDLTLRFPGLTDLKKLLLGTGLNGEIAQIKDGWTQSPALL